ncbi:DUF6603 domain-containing protein [Ketobacter sp.]|uniref:DUF6603 domain-containing protein n=1 Tax=Ketobacter sp. TaxID=2083498 RepID=UPI000F1C7236|nr:DUF6603 domain-containing protein [Ketobacter sp.]RLT96974.1 MAG: hypothetical protein D9N14_13195 [Ketobacter sp.]
MGAEENLDVFSTLAEAVGLTQDGQLRGEWFQDPIGTANGSKRGLSSMMYTHQQREALMSFVDDVLGPPERETEDQAVWVPLFSESGATVFVVVEQASDSARVGFGIEYESGSSTPSVAVKAHVPVFQFAREGGASMDVSGGQPDWLVLGRSGANIELSLEVTLSNGAPVAGELYVGGVFLSILIPTDPADNFALAVGFRRLQLPGTRVPKDFDLNVDSLAELGPEFLEFMAGLLQAQADALDPANPDTAPFAALAGMFGLRTVTDIPAFPLEGLITRGVPALIQWLESIFTVTAARNAWLGQFGALVGGTVNASRGAIEFSSGIITGAIGLRVAASSGGGVQITPWTEVALRPQTGAEVRISADLLTTDTATGDISALPSLQAGAVFGRDAGLATHLLEGDPGIGSIHLGIKLLSGQPAFMLTAHDVTLGGAAHSILDLSSPEAVLDAAGGVINSALVNALNDLGRPGELVAVLLGINPPAGITALNPLELLTDPLAELKDYWQSLKGNASAFADVLAALRELITGATGALNGSGTEVAPWVIEIGPLQVLVYLQGDYIFLALSAELAATVMTDYEAVMAVRARMARIDVVNPAVQFFSVFAGGLHLRRADRNTARLDLGPVDLLANAFGFELAWNARDGVGFAVAAPGLALELEGGLEASGDASSTLSVSIPLPEFHGDGSVTYSPDWNEIEQAIAALLARIGSPVVDVLLNLVGWSGQGARLQLGELISHPETALRTWLGDLILDCSNVRTALSPLAYLISGFRLSAPLGSGNERDPFRLAIAGEPRAPGVAVWLDPGCRLPLTRYEPPPGFFDRSEPPEEGVLVAALQDAGRSIPDLKDLLVGRQSLAQGLQNLSDRITGTDGLLGQPAVLPPGVNGIDIEGYSYRELVALGAIDAILMEALDPVPGAVLYVGCEDVWTTCFDGHSFDARSGNASGTVDASGDGSWSLALPDPAAAVAARPDRGAVGEQAERLKTALAGRTAAITVVAYGAAGAAAIKAAETTPAIERVVTVGSPWAPLAVSGYTTGLSGDALRFLQQIRRPFTEELDEHLLAGESGPLLQMSYVIERAVAAAGFTESKLGEIPLASDQVRRAGLNVDAVFGKLDGDTVDRGLAELVADAIAYRYESLAEPVGPPTALHAGVDLPVFDVSLGPVLLGAGAILELISCDRGASGDSFAVHTHQQVILDLHFGVNDGWLIGGPGALQNDVEARWLSVRLYLPINSGSGTGSSGSSGSGSGSPLAKARFIFHEANCFGVKRERWVIEPDADGIAATLPTSEVHLLMAEVIGRLAAESAELAQLLADLGLVRSGGYDPQGFDRLIFDTQLVITDALTQSATSMAGALRTIGGFTGSGSNLAWTIDSATVSLNLQTRSIEVSAQHAPAELVPVGASVRINSSGVAVSASLGEIDPGAGGIQLRTSIDTAAVSSGQLGLDWRLPGAANTATIDLLNLSDPSDLIRLSASLVPATLATGFINHLRDEADDSARSAIDTLLNSLNLLGPVPESGQRRMLLPWALFLDPMAWLQHATSAWSSDPFGQAVMTLDAVADLVVPARTGAGWPVSEDVTLTYAVDSGRLLLGVEIDLNHTLGTAAMAVSINGGIAISSNGSVLPQLTTAVTFDGKGVSLAISPDIRIALLRPPAAPMPIYPNGPGAASLLATGAGMAIPLVLNALIAERSNPAPSLQKDVGLALFEIGGALNLLEANSFTDARISAFAADPVAALTANLPNLVATAIGQLAAALDPAGTVVSTTVVGPGITRLNLGSTAPLAVTFDGSVSGPAIELAGAIAIADVGTLRADKVRLSSSGVQIAVSYMADGFDVGNGLELLPVATIRAGVSGAGFTRMVGVGLATDGVGDQSVEFRWALDASPPRVVLVNRTLGGETEDSSPEAVALALLSQAISMASGIVLEALDPMGAQVVTSLQDVVFTGGGATLDPQLFADFSDPEALLNRLYNLAFNLAGANLKITIDGKVDIGFTKNGNQAGVAISLTPGERIALASGDPTVDLEIVAGWIKSPGIVPGLSVYLIEKVGDNFEFSAGFAIAGLGVRVGKNAGPLLNLGIMSIDAIGVHVYGEAGSGGGGGGVQVQLDGLAMVPSAAGGDNAVANNLMSDAGNDASPSARPAFSPTIAIQKPPGQNLGISLSAGDPPGPWWLVIQRQLGPIYLEQFGFDVRETNGTVTGISLLFDARVSLFGLNAEVDQLGLHWLGGDVFALENWAVDLQGLGVSGDFSGLSISGGLLKTNIDGKIGYVGMLMGRFGVYGLSLFGGYNEDKGLPSFFVFGAIQGPIGGPPAFFLTGIGGGLGIKRGLRVPDDLSKFGEYPFIKALDPSAPVSANPLDELRKLAEYFPPEPGNFWFAAGISFTSFSLVDGVAVLSVSIGNGLDINLFGLARMALPRPQAALVSIELGLLARFSSSEGLFLIQAQLTDNSWLLYPEVRLTGGFAFATWWKGENAGQFVLTLGGYHPSFHRNGYPVVPRLGLEWRVSNAIVIKGGSYFALTSEALMAGVEIEVSADFGFIWARISFGANAIVYFDPFYFMADAYARIAAGVKIKTFFGTIRISISIGARIEVEGPKFHGKASIEVGPCDITVRFGSSNSIKGIFVDWDGFVPKYLEETGPGRARAISGISGKGSLPAATDGDTSAPSCDGSAERPFEVFAEFEISMVTTVPTKRFDFGRSDLAKNITPTLPGGTGTALGLSPMNASNLSSTFSLRLKKKSGNSWVDRTADLVPLVNGMKEESQAGDGPSYGLEAFPIGVWGLPEDANQPSSPLPKGDVIFAGSRLKLVAAADTSKQVGPEIDYYRVESGRKPLPLSAAGAKRVTMLGQANGLGVQAVAASVDAAFTQASQFLFSAAPATPEGLLERGQRSATAKAAYTRSRTAPPLFGTLMDGLESANGTNVGAADMGAVVAPVTRQPRAPFVTGLMTSGAGVAERLRGTTVANRRIKRRPAPSLDSVRGRLGRSLPIKLNLTAAPSRVADQTIVVRGSVPRTNLGGVARSYQGGQVGAAIAAGLVKGLHQGADTRAPGTRAPADTRLRPGDVVTLRLPDAAIDTGAQRPGLKVSGEARVVMLLGNGAVLTDQVVNDTTLSVPAHTAIIAIQANGGAGDLLGGGRKVLGWHDQSRVVRLAGRSALASGCILHLDGNSARSKVGWGIAGDVIRDGAAVSTRFATAVRCVGVILRGSEARHPEDLGIELNGAKHVRDASGEVTPVVVQAGARSILLFQVTPDARTAAVSVRVTQGGSRQVSGVIGVNAAVDDVADWIAELGLVAVVARLRAAQGDGCAIEWIEPPRP